MAHNGSAIRRWNVIVFALLCGCSAGDGPVIWCDDQGHSQPLISLEDYDESCLTDADCVLVSIDLCAPLCCPSYSMSRSAAEQREHDLRDRGYQPPAMPATCRCGAIREPHCNSGSCRVPDPSALQVCPAADGCNRGPSS